MRFMVATTFRCVRETVECSICGGLPADRAHSSVYCRRLAAFDFWHIVIHRHVGLKARKAIAAVFRLAKHTE